LIGYYKKSLLDAFRRLKEIQQMPESSLKKSLELQMILINRIVSIERRIRENKLSMETLKKYKIRVSP